MFVRAFLQVVGATALVLFPISPLLGSARWRRGRRRQPWQLRRQRQFPRIVCGSYGAAQRRLVVWQRALASLLVFSLFLLS